MKLQLVNVHKSFAERKVLAGLNLEVNAGEVVSFIGSSGSGKTTLLRCVNLLEPVDIGSIFLDGDEISQIGRDPDPIRRRIGIVFQSFNLFPHMSVLDNITLSPIRVHKISKAQARDEAMTLLRRFDLADKADQFPDRLSGGQQQRVAIIRSIAVKPRLLLLDEITSSLDPVLVNEVLSIVRDLKTEGMAMVLATHEMGFATQVADEVCFLKNGKIVERGPASQVISAPQHIDTQDFLQRVHEAGRL